MLRRNTVIVIILGIALLAAIAIAVILGRHNSSPSSSSSSSSVGDRVIIVGAGIAGARAALSLARAGVPFVILEAHSSTGGRLRKADLATTPSNTSSSNSTSSVTVELGANWVHSYGAGHPIESYIDSTSLQLNGVPTGFTSLHMFSTSSSPSFDYPNATRIPPDAVRSSFSAFESALQSAVDYDASDIVLKTALATRSDWDVTALTPGQCGAQYFGVDYNYGSDTSQIGTHAVDTDVTPGGDPASERFILDERGYQVVVTQLLSDADVQPGVNLFTAAKVDVIDYDTDGNGMVSVTLANGTTVEGGAVIVTVSVGVLQASVTARSDGTQVEQKQSGNAIRFVPRLSERKTAALDKLAMGQYTKVFISFKRAVMNSSHPLISMPIRQNTPECDSASAVTVQNMNRPPFLPGSNVVLVTFTGTFSQLLDAAAASTDSGVDPYIRTALAAVNAVTGDGGAQQATEEDVVASVRGRWNEDDLTRGAYSFRRPRFTDDDWKALVKGEGPNGDGSLFLAGEATGARDDFGSVKTAWSAGVDAAKRAEKAIGQRRRRRRRRRR